MTAEATTNLTSSVPGVNKRPWYRLHRLTVVVTVLIAVIFGLLNIPGDTDPYDEEVLLHGWPAIYLEREGKYTQSYPDKSLNWWSVSQDWIEFRPVALILDWIVALAAIGTIAAICEWRRRHRRRNPRWQFTLTQLLVFVTLIACAIGWWAARGRYEEQLLSLVPTPATVSYSNQPVLKPRFPHWVRNLVGDERLRSLHWNDFDFKYYGSGSLAVKRQAIDEVTRVLSIAPQCMYLRFGDSEDVDHLGSFLNDPYVIRHLVISHKAATDAFLDRVAQLRSLRSLYLELRDPINVSKVLRKNLPEVALPSRETKDRPAAKLNADFCRALRTVEVLTLSGCEIDVELAKGFQCCQNLTELVFEQCTFSPGALEACLPLPRLRQLEFRRCILPAHVLGGLAASRDLRLLKAEDLETLLNLSTLPPLPRLRQIVNPAQLDEPPFLRDHDKFPRLHSINFLPLMRQNR